MSHGVEGSIYGVSGAESLPVILSRVNILDSVH